MIENVKVGQVWVDSDPQADGPKLTVVKVTQTHAYVETPREWAHGGTRRIHLSQFASEGAAYRLLAECAPEVDTPNEAQKDLINRAITDGERFEVGDDEWAALNTCCRKGWMAAAPGVQLGFVVTDAGRAAVGYLASGLTVIEIADLVQADMAEAANELNADQLAMQLQADQVHVRGALEPSHPDTMGAPCRSIVAPFVDELYDGLRAGDRVTAEMVANVSKILNERAAETPSDGRADYATTARFTQMEVDERVATERHEERMAVAHQVRGMFDGQPLSKSMLDYIARQIELG